MKSKVLDRPMFKKKNKDIDPENVGIMQGFADMLDEEELSALEGEDESGDYDTAKMTERTPKTPEILMNNLRGDMRSIDARVEELADLVGYNAAASTPTEVLALLQPVLAAEAQKGIGALPAAGMVQPPPGMMPPAMPGGMPPGMPPMPPAAGPGMDMPPIPETTPAGMPAGGIESLMAGAGGPAPVNMYKGGLVQHFQTGSTEAGVTPADSPAAATGNWPADTIALARQKVADYLLRQPLSVPDLAAGTQKRVPLYLQILGIDKNVAQGQALMDFGQAAFNYAANVDEQGRPLRGSAISRLSRAVSPLPGKLGARIAEQAKADQSIKLAALQATEAEQAKIREQNLKLTDAQWATWQKIAGASPTTPFGSGVEGRTLQFFTELAPGYGKGTLTPDQDRLFEVAVTNYTQKRPYEFTDSRGNRTFQLLQNELPAAVKQAIADRIKLNADQGRTNAAPSRPSDNRASGTAATTTSSASGAPTTLPTVSGDSGAGTATTPNVSSSTTPSASGAAATTPAPSGPIVALLSPEQKNKLPPGWSVKPDGTVNIPQQSFFRPYNLFATNPDSVTYYQRPGSGTPTLFTAANLGTGPISAIGGFAYATPGIGGAIGSELMSKAREFIQQTGREFGKALAVNPHYAEGEQKRIAKEISIDPKLWDNPDALKSRIFVLEDTLRRMQKEALSAAVNTELSAEKQNNARSAVQDIHALRMTLGAPPVIYSDTDPRLKVLAPGTIIIFRDRWAVVPQPQATQQGGRR